MKIPLLDLDRQYAEIGTELEEAVLRVLRSSRYIMGPELDAFEGEAAKYLETRHAIGMSSGTDALLAALMALDIGVGDEVIVPSYTFFATAGSVARVGARPVFADVDDESLNITADTLGPLIGPKTRCVIVVHLFGRAADMQPIVKLLEPRGIHIIEDAAQAIGARHRGQSVGKSGRMTCYSFFPSKNLGAAGDGGLVTTDEDDLADRLRRLRNHGQTEAYEHVEVGGNFRLDAMQAAVLRVKLLHLETWHHKRRLVAQHWCRLFLEAGLDDMLRCPRDEADRHVYHQFVVRVPHDQRERCLTALREAEIGHAVYYRTPLHQQPCFAEAERAALPVSEAASREAIALPVFPELRLDEQEYVLDKLARVLSD